MLDDYCRELGTEYHIDGDPTSVWADIYRDIDERHDIEVANYAVNRRAGTNVVQVNLWLLPSTGEVASRRMLVNVLEVPSDPVVVRQVSNRLARLVQCPNVDELCVRCSYTDLDELVAPTSCS